jgi:molecular chaperone DnaK (HSP70)
MAPVAKALKDAGLSVSDIDEVIQEVLTHAKNR